MLMLLEAVCPALTWSDGSQIRKQILLKTERRWDRASRSSRCFLFLGMIFAETACKYFNFSEIV